MILNLGCFSRHPISVERITRVVMRMANAHYACWETRFAVGKALVLGGPATAHSGYRMAVFTDFGLGQRL